MQCKICQSETYVLHDKQFHIDYFRCKSCGFIYEDPTKHPTVLDEKNEYDRHNNSIEDEGYVNMFKRFIKAFEPFVDGRETLEFGSGPEPVFSEVLRREGYDVTSYDPFYLPNESYLDKTYHLITSTEVFEHFVNPIKEIEKLVGLLKPNGVLAIMTQFPKDDEHFLKWWYRRDVTHISFFTHKAFEVIGKSYGLTIVHKNEKDYMIFKRL